MGKLTWRNHTYWYFGTVSIFRFSAKEDQISNLTSSLGKKLTNLLNRDTEITDLKRQMFEFSTQNEKILRRMSQFSTGYVRADQLVNLSRSSDLIASILNDSLVRLKFVEDFVSSHPISSTGQRLNETLTDESAKQLIRDLFVEMTQHKTETNSALASLTEKVDQKLGDEAKEDLEKIKIEIKKLTNKGKSSNLITL